MSARLSGIMLLGLLIPCPGWTAEQKERLKERDRYAKETAKLRQEGKLEEALAACRKKLAIEREVLGNMHDEVAGSLQQLAELYEQREDFAAARHARQEVLRIQQQLHGEKDWRFTDAGRALKDTDRLAQMDQEQRRQLAQAVQMHQQAEKLYLQGKYPEALSLVRQVVEIRKKALGQVHPSYAEGLNDLALMCWFLGDYAQAEPLYRQAIEIYQKALAGPHPLYADSLNNLALLYWSMAQYAKAEPLYHEALEIRNKALGESHPYHAQSLSNLASLYQAMGDYARAEPLFRQAQEIKKQALGEAHPRYALGLDNLAELYREMGDYAKAEPLCRQAAELRKKGLGEDHHRYATSLDHLAGLYQDMGQDAKAEPLFRQALEIYKKAVGETHHEYAGSLNHLALLYRDKGEYATALPLCRQAVAIDKQALGEAHPAYAQSLHNLALLHWSMGEYDQALPLCRQAVEIERRNLGLTAAVQSERQQLAMSRQLRGYLDDYVALAPLAQEPAAAVYGQLLAWKGTVFLQQQHLHTERSQPELARLFADWQQSCRRLAAEAFRTPDPKERPAWNRQLAELTEQKERLETQLASKSAAFRQTQGQQHRTATEIQAALPPDGVLVDFLEFQRYQPPSQEKKKPSREQRLAAFIVRPGRSLVQLDLGPVSAIAEAVERWRASWGQGEPPAGPTDPALALRRLVWEPLAKHLDGAKTLLVSPDGPLLRFPVPALPGQKPGSYLVEDYAVAVLPVPRLLPELLVAAAKPAGEPSTAGLLLIGDVDYGTAPGQAVPDVASVYRSAAPVRDGGRPQFEPLPQTLGEVQVIQKHFQRRFPGRPVQLLEGQQATATAFRQAAPQHRYLHLATHGFFAPAQLKSALAPHVEKEDGPQAGSDFFGRQGVSGWHPGLLSGLVLAGANRPSRPAQDDGFLTALEVSEVDLSGVDLAVLSACDTGLGAQVAGGEGLMGLQRAFQVAGARTVLASLWEVPDEATRALMERFYDNLWQKKLGKLEALRQAQLWMLREGPEHLGELVPRGSVRKKPGPVASSTIFTRMPSYYWAAFVLSGDWR